MTRLLCSGKILADDKTVGDLNLKEKDFCVVRARCVLVPHKGELTSDCRSWLPRSVHQSAPSICLPDINLAA